jgi:transcription elongation GreA/GreB family factor
MSAAPETLRLAVLAALGSEHERQVHAALDAREESISEESRAENKYDTHAQEAAYLAEGQARLATELATALAAWRALVFPPPGHTEAALGSRVTLSKGPELDHLLLGPAGGGLAVLAEGRSYTVVTPASPLGRQLLGRSLGARLPALRPGGPARILSALE